MKRRSVICAAVTLPAFALALAPRYGAGQTPAKQRLETVPRQAPTPLPTTASTVVVPTMPPSSLPTWTLSDAANGGACLSWSEAYRQQCTAKGQNCSGSTTTWNAEKKECRATSMNVPEGKSLKIEKGVTLKIQARFMALGEIVNWGNFVIGVYPERATSGFVKGGTLVNKGRFENKKQAVVDCQTNSYFENYGTFESAGATALGCNVKLETGTFTSTGYVEIRQGTPRGDGFYDRTVNDGIFLSASPVKIVNTGTILQRAYTSVVNRGVFENFGSYSMVGGAFRNWGTFENICKGKTEGLTIAEGKAVASKPCDTDGDGIPDPSDQCPKDKEVVNGFEDKDGCPDATGSGGPQ
jgi:hypothetical protein